MGIDATSLAADTLPRDAELALVERMASLGTLTAGVAHEINNPLAYVLGSLDIGLRELAELKALIRADAREQQTLILGALAALDNARDGAERMRHIVRDLTDMSRASAQVEATDVEAVLDSTVRVAWNEIRHRARLVKAYGGISRVSGDEARLGQVFLNLIINAAQAIEGDPMANEIRLSTANIDGSAVIEVSDTGVGISSRDLPHIFDPFYTTKSAGVGTGLGLAICHGIVAELGGEISVSSGENRGSSFRVVLPFAPEESAARRAVGEIPQESESGPARILIIDDEPLLGQTLLYAFKGRHEVVISTSGREALSRLEKDARFDLVLCDLMMPDVSGSAVYEAVKRTYPGLVRCFVFMTGGAFTERARQFLATHPGIQLEKPFNIDDIERLLRQFAGAR
ncbi:MAG TPA: ATP-binding protein [Polyangiaceae bacterium]|nr:ATP-binding protein [Polyangiaceae bacterium]